MINMLHVVMRDYSQLQNIYNIHFAHTLHTVNHLNVNVLPRFTVSGIDECSECHSSRSVCGFRKRHIAPSEWWFFFLDNKLYSRKDLISRHCGGFQRVTPPPEPNLALVVKACFGNIPSGMSPAALAPSIVMEPQCCLLLQSLKTRRKMIL